MVICTDRMWSRFQNGSKMALANRRNKMSMAGSLPRKWSNAQDLPFREELVQFGVQGPGRRQVVAEGLSTTTRARSIRPAPARPSTTRPNSDGGISI